MGRIGGKGVVAMLDCLIAYTTAFISLGLLTLLMTNTETADVKTRYELNQWAEDLADSIGRSMVDPSMADYSEAWFDETHPSIRGDLEHSLNSISENVGISIYADIDGSMPPFYNSAIRFPSNDITKSREIATAKRLLRDCVYNVGDPANQSDDSCNANPNNIRVLTVKVGIK